VLVALTAEGTYPHQFGGVSVWCDQLIRAMPGYEFAVVALVATGAEPVQWELPPNVARLTTIPLWGPPPPVRLRARLPGSRVVPLPVQALVDVLLDKTDAARGRFTTVLRDLLEYAQTRNLTATLSSEPVVRLLITTWRERWPQLAADHHAMPDPPTLTDAVTAMQLIEHALRPLSHPPVHADVVHAVTNGLGALPALAAKWLYRVPMIVTEHGVYMREQYMHLRQPLFGWPVKDLYLRFLTQVCALGYREAEVITPGNIYNRRWEEQLGAERARIRTVYNGVNPAAFPVLTSEPGVPTICWVGRVDPIKDLETLLRAFAIVVQQMPRARLRMFGAPPQGRESYLERCVALAAELGISDRATFEGRVPEIRDAYAAGHVVVLCSISEGFPYSLIEAMTCGRACVATDVGGVSEALADDAGITVPPRDPAALAAACLRLLGDDDLRRAYGTAARQRALEHFTVDRAVSAFDEIYSRFGTGYRVMPMSSDLPA
jgi:glycosyltransferase involved in cell wall biosynthesis